MSKEFYILVPFLSFHLLQSHGGRTAARGPLRLCSDIVIGKAQLFNGQLVLTVSSLQATLSGSTFQFIDFYTALLKIIQNPFSSGFSPWKNIALVASARKQELAVPEDSSLLYKTADKKSAIEGSRKLQRCSTL
ncbi:hypothetical protein Ahy_B10g102043 isoform D [Arachis hypogaea]|uniref:Uncharacterized protein n=1 Tax=Arachis hypogaea TaxID=3818 RepID=A0A444X190_ARAHY|nr:hypothetical protein Ahy_B10g102043 isoform D [Arachis hypogaea]